MDIAHAILEKIITYKNDVICMMWFEDLKWRSQLVKQCINELNKTVKECNKLHVEIVKFANNVACIFKKKNSNEDALVDDIKEEFQNNIKSLSKEKILGREKFKKMVNISAFLNCNVDKFVNI